MRIKEENGTYKAGKLTVMCDKDIHGRHFYEVSHPDRMPTLEECEKLIRQVYHYEGYLVIMLNMAADEYIGYEAYDDLPYAVKLYEVCTDGTACPVCGKGLIK